MNAISMAISTDGLEEIGERGKSSVQKNGRPFPIPIYDQREWLKLNPPTTFNDLFGDIE